MSNEESILKLLEFIKEVALEQATREMSGINWFRDLHNRVIAFQDEILNSEQKVKVSDTGDDDSKEEAGKQKEKRKDDAWNDLGNTLRDMGNEEPEW